jgi:hypothetical protein
MRATPPGWINCVSASSDKSSLKTLTAPPENLLSTPPQRKGKILCLCVKNINVVWCYYQATARITCMLWVNRQFLGAHVTKLKHIYTHQAQYKAHLMYKKAKSCLGGSTRVMRVGAPRHTLLYLYSRCIVTHYCLKVLLKPHQADYYTDTRQRVG